MTAFGRTFPGHPQVKYGVFLVVGARTSNDTFTRVTEEFPASLYFTDAKRELDDARKS